MRIYYGSVTSEAPLGIDSLRHNLAAPGTTKYKILQGIPIMLNLFFYRFKQKVGAIIPGKIIEINYLHTQMYTRLSHTKPYTYMYIRVHK